jgi:Cellulose binding domain
MSVQVSYVVLHQWEGRFHGQFTIVNNGSTAISGWQLSVVLPDDTVQRVWKGQFHTQGDTLYIDPSSSHQTIAPGETVTENVIANGSTTNPTSCTFNGSACQIGSGDGAE